MECGRAGSETGRGSPRQAAGDTAGGPATRRAEPAKDRPERGRIRGPSHARRGRRRSHGDTEDSATPRDCETLELHLWSGPCGGGRLEERMPLEVERRRDQVRRELAYVGVVPADDLVVAHALHADAV